MLEEYYYFIVGTEAYIHQNSEHVFECYPPGMFGPLPKPLARIVLKLALHFGGMKTFLRVHGLGRHSVETQVGKTDVGLHL